MMVGTWALALALCLGCSSAHDGGGGNVGPDAGTPDSGQPDAGPPDAGPPDAGPPDAGPPDAGPDAGPADAGPADAGPADGGSFAGPSPWPLGNTTYGSTDGIQEGRVVGTSTDEKQNLWVATNAALYLMKPGNKSFHRYDARDGLHLPGNSDASCGDPYGTMTPCLHGDADAPGISEIVGGGPDEVFVGYFGHHDWNDPNDGEWNDPWRHSGKLDRVRLKPDGSLEAVRFDMVSGESVQFWHNRIVLRMVYDHFINKHELYVGTEHGVNKFSPDKWHPTNPGTWFNSPENNLQWMSDHLHPQACYHHPCGTGTADLRLGDWRGLAIAPDGDLWVAGRWAAGKIVYVADNSLWFKQGGAAYAPPRGMSFGDPYYGNCSGSRPVFCVPLEGDIVNLSAVTVATDGRVWFANSIFSSDPAERSYGIAVYDGKSFTYFDPVSDAGMSEVNVRDMVALPDGRLVLAGATTGLVFWDPVKGTHTQVRGGQGIPDDHVHRLELDTMVNPPALHVSTWGGATVLRVWP